MTSYDGSRLDLDVLSPTMKSCDDTRDIIVVLCYLLRIQLKYNKILEVGLYSGYVHLHLRATLHYSGEVQWSVKNISSRHGYLRLGMI